MAEGMFGYTPSGNITPNINGAIEASKQGDIFDSMIKTVQMGVNVYDKTIGEENRLQSSIKGYQDSNSFTADLQLMGDISNTERVNRINAKLLALSEAKDKGEIDDTYYKTMSSHLLEQQVSFNKAAKVEVKHNSAKAIMELGLSAMDYVPAVNEKGESMDGLSPSLRSILQKTSIQSRRLDILELPKYTIEAEDNLVKLKEEINKLSDVDKEIANGYLASVSTKYNDRIKDINTNTERIKASILNTLADSRNPHAINDARKQLSIFTNEIKDYKDGNIKNHLIAQATTLDTHIKNEVEKKDRQAKLDAAEANKTANINITNQKKLAVNNALLQSIYSNDVNKIAQIASNPELNNFVKGALNIYSDDTVVSQMTPEAQIQVVAIGSKLMAAGNTTIVSNLFGSVANFTKLKIAAATLPKDNKTSLYSYIHAMEQKKEFNKVEINSNEYSKEDWGNKTEFQDTYKTLRQTYDEKTAKKKTEEYYKQSFQPYTYVGLDDKNKNTSYTIRNSQGVFSNPNGVAELLHTWATGSNIDGIKEGFMPKGSIVELEGGIMYVRNKDGTPVLIKTSRGIEEMKFSVSDIETWSNSLTINNRIKAKQDKIIKKMEEDSKYRADSYFGTTNSQKAKDKKTLIDNITSNPFRM